MAWEMDSSHGPGSPQRVLPKTEHSKVELVSRGQESLPTSCVKQERTELFVTNPELQRPTHIKEEEYETTVTSLLLLTKQESEDKEIPDSKPMKLELHDPASQTCTTREEEKAELKKSGGVFHPKNSGLPKLQAPSQPSAAAGSSPVSREEDETEPEVQEDQHPGDWLAPVEDDEALGESQRRRGFESASRSLSSILGSDSELDDKEGEEDPTWAPADPQTLQDNPDADIPALREASPLWHRKRTSSSRGRGKRGREGGRGGVSSFPEPQKKPKNFSCQECGKAFISRRDRERHIRTHSGEKPFPCPRCDKRFNDSGNMRKHMLIHSGERPHLCPDCGRGFSERGNLSRHRAHIHGSMPKSECEDCGKTYIEKGGLDRHIRSGACSATRKT
ncbi:uncharacterized protein ACWYII_045680 [Salvelinus alpinus]|uniref:zinc finger protein 771-like n=1 Tax=Salvelinus alpinus TaxID=8036 RepID=UPI0039FC6306